MRPDRLDGGAHAGHLMAGQIAWDNPGTRPERGAPSIVLRGTLFAAVQSKGRIVLDSATLAARFGIGPVTASR